MLLDTSHVSALSTVSTTSIYSPDGFSSRRKQERGLEIGVHPHYRREMVILDAVAGLRVVWDDFPAAAGGARCRSASDEISERTSATAVSFINVCKGPSQLSRQVVSCNTPSFFLTKCAFGTA